MPEDETANGDLLPEKRRDEPDLPALADDTPGALLKLAVQRDLDLDKLERLMALKERWQADQARKAFYEAFARFQATVPPLTKDKQVTFGETSYRHASLASIMGQIGGPLEECGLSFRFTINDSGEGLVVTCIVTHVEGHSEPTAMSAPPDVSGSKNAIQSRGSTVTYLQRYTLIAALGLVTADEDNDGRSSGAGRRRAPRQAKAASKPGPALLEGAPGGGTIAWDIGEGKWLWRESKNEPVLDGECQVITHGHASDAYKAAKDQGDDETMAAIEKRLRDGKGRQHTWMRKFKCEEYGACFYTTSNFEKLGIVVGCAVTWNTEELKARVTVPGRDAGTYMADGVRVQHVRATTEEPERQAEVDAHAAGKPDTEAAESAPAVEKEDIDDSQPQSTSSPEPTSSETPPPPAASATEVTRLRQLIALHEDDLRKTKDDVIRTLIGEELIAAVYGDEDELHTPGDGASAVRCLQWHNLGPCEAGDVEDVEKLGVYLAALEAARARASDFEDVPF